jgi:two-component system, NtrC family, sensor kinase
MKKSVLLLSILLSVQLLHGQNQENDSIRNLFATAKNDTARLYILDSFVWLKTWSNPEYALELAKRELLLARKVKLRQAEATALATNATVLSVLGDYSHAIDYYLQSIKLCEQFKYTKSLQLAYLNISETYSDAGDYNNAIMYAYKGKEIIDTMKLKDAQVRMLTFAYIGEAYEKFGKLDSAFFYLQKARAFDSIYFKKQSGFIALHLAGTSAKKNQFSYAMQYYRETINDSKINNYQSDLMDACNGLAKVFSETGQADSAIFYTKQALLIGKNTAYPLAILNAVTLLSNIYKSKNDLDSTVKYMGMSILIKDSLFNREKVRQVQDVSFNEQLRQQELQQKIEQNELQYRNRLNIYILVAGLVILLIIAGGLWRRNIYRKKSFALLQKQKQEIDNQKQKVESALEDLKSTQAQLIQSEKMASLGELTAGIAHEIQNPLNFVNNFSEVNKEMVDEATEEIDKGNYDEVKIILNDIKDNSEKINHHGKRADAIVKGMLQHSRSSTGVKELTDINALADEYLRLSYHGLRAKDKDFNAIMKTDFDKSIGKINIIPQDIGRVLLNLYNNAFYAVSEKKKQHLEGYEPTVSVSSKKIGDNVILTVKDNGNGIPQKVLDKIFQPFFTTKPTGVGTGLGLSLSYDIIKAHGGEIKVKTIEGEFTEFVIQLPISV